MNREVDEHGQRAQQQQQATSYARSGHGTARAGHANDARLELARWREVGRNLGSQIEEQARKRPYVVIGAAAGAGFVLGSLFGSRLGQVLLAAGIGYVVKNVVDGEIAVERLQESLEKLSGERT